ncbi:MAG: hypothetical protein OXH85_07505 [Truepera sp.]|nr:hypothetical protein [Truepera sp.]
MGIHFQGVHGPRLQYQRTREARHRRLKRRWQVVDLLREQVGPAIVLNAGRWSPLPSQAALATELGCSQATVSRDLAYLRRLLSEKASSLPLFMGGWPVLYCLLAGWGFRLTGREERSLPGEPTHLLTKVYLPRRDRRRRRDPKSPTLARELLVCPPPTSWYEWLEAA